MCRLSNNLRAFANPQETPAYFGGRFITPGERRSLDDYGTEALRQTLGRLIRAVGSYISETHEQDPPVIQAKKELAQNLEVVAQKVQESFEKVVPDLKEGFQDLGQYPEEIGLLFYYGSYMSQLPQISKGVLHHLSPYADLSALEDEIFLNLHTQLTSDAPPSKGPHLKPLFAWWTFGIAPPLDLLIKVAKNPSSPIPIEDLDHLKNWASSCDVLETPPTASDFYELIRNMCTCEGALTRGLNVDQSLTMEERCLRTLELLWSSIKLNLYSTNSTSVNKYELLRAGDTICIQNPLLESFGMPKEKVFAKVIEIAKSHHYEGVLKVLTVEILGPVEDDDKTYEVLIFNDPILGLLHHRRMQTRLSRCPLFQKDAHFEMQEDSSIHASYIFSSCEVSMRRPLAPFNGDFEQKLESLKPILIWMAENKTCFPLGTKNLGLCPKGEIKLKAPFTKGSKKTVEGSSNDISTEEIELHIFKDQKLGTLSDRMLEVLDAFYTKATKENRREELSKIRKDGARLSWKDLDPVTRNVLDVIEKFESPPDSSEQLLHDAIDRLFDRTTGSIQFKVLARVQSKRLRPEVNRALTRMLIAEARKLHAERE